MKVALLQLPSIGMGSNKLDSYIKAAHSKDVKLIMLGEYILNPFFKELVNTPINLIKEQSSFQLEYLKEQAKKYGITIVAPIVIVKKKELFKSIAKIAPTSTTYYNQQLLINYPHWNEEKFFANPIEPLHEMMTFSLNGFKFGVMAGFESHFDELWSSVESKNLDCVIVPSASTFDSHNRWRELLKMRAFTHNCYILRINRVGEYHDDSHAWKFYGDSMVLNPDGDIDLDLANTEELMIIELDKTHLNESRRDWGFRAAIKKRMP